MKSIISVLILLITAIVLQSCSQPVNQAVDQPINNLTGNWETGGIFANGYYSEFLRVVLTFNDDFSCGQDTYFVSSGKIRDTYECRYAIENNQILITFNDQPTIKTVLNGDELTLAHPRGVATGSGSPQIFTRIQ